MFNKICRGMKKQKGFTLVELMVVVVIIGILVAIAIPVYSSVQKTAQIGAIQANVRTVQGAIQIYQANNQTYPTSSDAAALITLLTGNTNGGPYLKPLTYPVSVTQSYVSATGKYTVTFDSVVYGS